MAELLAYEINYYYKLNKKSIQNIPGIYNTIHTQIPHKKYQKQIMRLGISMANNLYDIPILKD